MNKKRKAIWDKSGGKCWYCGCDLPEKGWHADHVDPAIRIGGEMIHKDKDNDENLVPSCHKCNLHKHCSDLENYRRIIEDGRREILASGKGKALVRLGILNMEDKPVVFWFEENGLG
jgi:5-methylcytosine-specific restriction endonuclease McrA